MDNDKIPKKNTRTKRKHTAEQLRALNPETMGKSSLSPNTIPPEIRIIKGPAVNNLNSKSNDKNKNVEFPVAASGVKSTHRRPEFLSKNKSDKSKSLRNIETKSNESRSSSEDSDSSSNSRSTSPSISFSVSPITTPIITTSITSNSPSVSTTSISSAVSSGYSRGSSNGVTIIGERKETTEESRVSIQDVPMKSLQERGKPLKVNKSGPQMKSVNDLKHSLVCYDGTPIFIVPSDYHNVVAGSFGPGMYGLDTESDYHTGELRIVQVYNGTNVYIFAVSLLEISASNLFLKFLKSNDRVKVGVDIHGDKTKIETYIRKRKSQDKESDDFKYKFAMNGTIDLQCIARSFKEPCLSLDKLSEKYVSDFQGNPSEYGDYMFPTEKQYVYAGNDAVLSLKIYYPLISHNPCPRWLETNMGPLFIPDNDYQEFADFVVTSLISLGIKKISSLVNYICNSYGPWSSKYPNDIKQSKAREFLEKMFFEKALDVYSSANDLVLMSLPKEYSSPTMVSKESTSQEKSTSQKKSPKPETPQPQKQESSQKQELPKKTETKNGKNSEKKQEKKQEKEKKQEQEKIPVNKTTSKEFDALLKEVTEELSKTRKQIQTRNSNGSQRKSPQSKVDSQSKNGNGRKSPIKQSQEKILDDFNPFNALRFGPRDAPIPETIKSRTTAFWRKYFSSILDVTSNKTDIIDGLSSGDIDAVTSIIVKLDKIKGKNFALVISSIIARIDMTAADRLKAAQDKLQSHAIGDLQDPRKHLRTEINLSHFEKGVKRGKDSTGISDLLRDSGKDGMVNVDEFFICNWNDVRRMFLTDETIDFICSDLKIMKEIFPDANERKIASVMLTELIITFGSAFNNVSARM